MQRHNIYFRPELNSFFTNILFWWWESRAAASSLSSTSRNSQKGSGLNVNMMSHALFHSLSPMKRGVVILEYARVIRGEKPAHSVHSGRQLTSFFGAFFLTSLIDKCFIFRLHSCSVPNPSVLFTLCGNILIPLLNTSVNSSVEFLHFHFTKRFSELWLIIQDFCPEHISSWKMNVHHDRSRFNNVLDSSEPSFSSS